MRRVIALVVVLSGLVAAAPAGATFHLVKVREVYPGSTAVSHNDAFVELQMYAAGQNLVGSHSVLTYNALGAPTAAFSFPANVPNGGDQRTVLIGDTLAAATPDLTDPALGANLGAAGGAVCWDVTKVDCVSWGGFNNAAALPTGPSAPSIPNGQSITRSIAAGCATALDIADDTDSSAADFALAPPTPRPNSVAPSETPCSGAGGDTKPPQTTITKQPKARTTKTTAKFRFHADEQYLEFQCKLDKGRFEDCSSPQKYKQLDPGKHKFQVAAIDDAGNTDPTPARARFKIVAKD